MSSRYHTHQCIASLPRLLLVLAFCLLAPVNCLFAQEEGDYKYHIHSDANGVPITASIWNYTGKASTISIPEKIAVPYRRPDGTSTTLDITVTELEFSAFSGADTLTSVIIPIGVTEIGSQAFTGCSNLATVSIRGAVKSIGSFAFNDCKKLRSFEIPESTISIGDYAFAGCDQITTITIPGSVTSIGDRAFQQCTSLATAIVMGKISQVGAGVFSLCTSLTSVSLPAGVSLIGNNSFEYCTSLVDINVPEGVTSIGAWAFHNCSGLLSVDLPDSITSIGTYAFSGCSSLSELKIPSGVTAVQPFAFAMCSSVERLEIPKSVTSIGSHSFAGCGSLLSVTIPPSVTTIGSNAFQLAAKLKTAVFLGTVKSIGADAFSYTSLSGAYFLGDAPTTFSSTAFDYAADDFSIYYYPLSLGFTSPTWKGYPCRMVYWPKLNIDSTTVAFGASTSLSLANADAFPGTYQWYRNGKPLLGSTTNSFALNATNSSDAGFYDLEIGGSSALVSAPAVIGVVPAAGQRTAGAVSTRDAWQNIHHPNGATYDQFLLTGSAGTFTADPGEIARMSYLDPQGSIVQVEMSGAGAITVVLDPTTASGPKAPALYNQSGIEYMQGKATIILSGADASTHFTIYSVGTFTNPGVTKPNVTYAGWADVAAAGIVSTDGKLGGIHQGNVNYNAAVGYAGIYAPTIGTVNGLVVVHDIAATGSAQPYLHFAPGGAVQVKIAGGSLAQFNGDTLTVAGLAKVTMGAGQDSCGRAAPAQPAATRLHDPDGNDVTAPVLVGP